MPRTHTDRNTYQRLQQACWLRISHVAALSAFSTLG